MAEVPGRSRGRLHNFAILAAQAKDGTVNVDVRVESGRVRESKCGEARRQPGPRGAGPLSPDEVEDLAESGLAPKALARRLTPRSPRGWECGAD